MTKNKVILLSYLLLILTCCNKSSKVFKLPNGEILKQSSVKDAETKFPCKFEPYRGFVSNYNDSLLKSFVFIIEKYNSAIVSDIVNQDKINELKLSKIDAIEFQFNLDNNFNKNFDVEKYLMKKYPNSTKTEITKTSFLLKEKDAVICKVEFHNIVKPCYSITIYPVW